MDVLRLPCALRLAILQRSQAVCVKSFSQTYGDVAYRSTRSLRTRPTRNRASREGPIGRVASKDVLVKDVGGDSPQTFASGLAAARRDAPREAVHSEGRSQAERQAPETSPKRQPEPTQPYDSLPNIDPAQLHTYNIATPPRPAQLRQASAFFTRHEALHLWRASRFKTIPSTSWPEVAVIGRSNVGKSSLLNALFECDKHVASISSKPGHTRTIAGYGVGGTLPKPKKGHSRSQKERWELYDPGAGTLVLVDMPGYGGGSREEWGAEVMKYFEKRKQLRKIYLLIDAEHGLKNSDVELLMHFRQNAFPYQLVLNKVDKLLPKKVGRAKNKPQEEWLSRQDLKPLQTAREEVMRKLNSAAEQRGLRTDVTEDILCCSGLSEHKLVVSGRRRAIGVDELRWSMLTVCGLESDSKVQLNNDLAVSHTSKEKTAALKDKEKARTEKNREAMEGAAAQRAAMAAKKARPTKPIAKWTKAKGDKLATHDKRRKSATSRPSRTNAR